MNERNQPSEAGSQSWVPNSRINRYRFGVDGGKNPNLLNQAAAPGSGGILKVGHPRGTQQGDQALPHEGGRISPAGYLALHGLYNWSFIRRRIAFDVDQAADKAQREIKAMAESARRSLAQILRRDRTEPHLTMRRMGLLK